MFIENQPSFKHCVRHLCTYVPNNRNKRVIEVYILISLILYIGASLIAQLVKNPPPMQETLVQFLGWEDPLEKG